MLNYRDLDWKLIGAALILSLIGVLLILSAQYHADSEFARTYYERQLIWLFIAIIIFVSVIHLPMRLFDVTAYMLFGVTLCALVAVLFIGSSRMGASRWFSFGPINLAPSDIAKLTLIFALARFFAYTKLGTASKQRLALSFMLTIIPTALILKQPDLGTSLVFPVILLALWFWSGLSLLHLFLIISPLVSLVAASHWIAWAAYIAVLLTILFLLRPGMLFGITAVVANLAFGIVTPFLWNRLADYQKLRILSFLDPGHDPRGAGYQIIQSKIAIGSGGITGKGFLGGSQTRLDFLPERHTDFVFSVLGEELGLWGALIVIFLFAFILYRAVRIAARCRSRFTSFVAFGAASILIFQFLVNVGMTLGFMPVTGLALPFVSYGGTSLVLSWTLVALLVSADYHWQEY
ncbi:MAG: rod shape-determining protein RodA [Candidatus Zixiibacteriota bacterium]|nr:MAG: rod shape-determining protein RodA [candidate division Zixibacteria bacterium]